MKEVEIPLREGAIKRRAHWIILALAVLWVLSGLRTPGVDSGPDHPGFGRLPVLLNGRVQPLDSVGMNALRQIRGTASVPLEGFGASGTWGRFEDMEDDTPCKTRRWFDFGRRPEKLGATRWLMEVLMDPGKADRRYIFRVNHPDLVDDLDLNDKGLDRSGLRFFCFNDIRSHVEKEDSKFRTDVHRAERKKPEVRTAFERAQVALSHSITLYMRLQNSLQPQDAGDFASEIDGYLESMDAGITAIHQEQAGGEYDREAYRSLIRDLERFDAAHRLSYPLLVPPADPEADRDDWTTVSTNLMAAIHLARIPPAVRNYARMSSALNKEDPEAFNQALTSQTTLLEEQFSPEAAKAGIEYRFNRFNPFGKSIALYIIALLLACSYWFVFTRWLNRTATLLVLLAAVIHTGGLLTRMFLEGRPPVTNLYSSAVFVGWGAVILGILLERFHRDGVGNVIASVVGFLTLVIAHNLSLKGDTMEMMQAVLDTNFWLATHVVIITLGYSATFVAGFLALVYILRGLLTRTLSGASAKALGRMVYGTICFATLFSFVGTILGGIWADQSWGRFWGWDPKENGALLIVIWNALILHCRWGGMIRERGLMILAVFGNVVTAFSWFGVNELSIGLHSYGFTEGAALWILYFTASQLGIILLASLVPKRFWFSFQVMEKGAGK